MTLRLRRKKVAVLLRQLDDGAPERPSDRAGLIRIPFSDDVGDARPQLAKDVNAQGLPIDLDSS